MQSEPIQVVCPCCASKLEVEARTGTVIRCSREDTGQSVDEHRATWAEAIERVRNRPVSSADKFAAGLLAERSPPRDLDDLLRKKAQCEGMERDPSEP